MLDAGDPAPDFYRPAIDDAEAEYMLSAAANASPVLLAFVPDPADDLLVRLGQIRWASVVDRIAIFGIADGREQRASFSAPEIPFPVLEDFEGYVAGQYLGADAPPRALVLVDQRCTVAWTWRASHADASPPMDDLENELRSLSS